MNIQRVYGVFTQEMYLSKRSLEITMDLLFFSLFNALVFGFISLFLAGDNNQATADVVLLGLVLWEVVRLTQYTITVSSLWNVWSRNLSNMFVAPLKLSEYLGAHMIASAVKTLIVFGLICLLMWLSFDFSILKIGIANLVIIYLNLTLFAWAFGIVLLGFIFRFGERIQALAWGTIFIFQTLAAAFFPLDIFPIFLQYIAYTIPATYFFEAGRRGLENGSTDWKLLSIGTVLNLLHSICAIYLFRFLFRRAKETGQLARSDS